MHFSRRSLLLSGLSAASFLAVPVCAQGPVFRPEDFGAVGDGRTNDTDAFAAMSAAVNRAGGGTVELRRTTYLVGRQTRRTAPGGDWAYAPADIMVFRGLRAPLAVRGNGARLLCAPGLRFGTFDPATERATERPMPNYRHDEIASPYHAMILVENCLDQVSISDLELNGNLPAMRIGGPFGDTGRQLPGTGLFLRNNLGREVVSRVNCHHHPQDGVMIDGLDDRRARSTFTDVTCAYNARQGMSIIGGRGYDFVGCKFNHTGRSVIASAPSAGVDIEAEGEKLNRDHSFTGCEFVDNTGCGFLAEAGDNDGVRLERCRFVGTTVWSIWPRMPNARFDDCTIVGSGVNPFADKDPARATQFHDCRFLDDPRQSPNGLVYTGADSHPIMDMGASDNVLFDGCEFRMTHKGRLPWGWRATYRDCTMSQMHPEVAYPKGLYLGHNTIRGNVDLYNSKIEGELIANGKPIGRGLLGGDPW